MKSRLLVVVVLYASLMQLSRADEALPAVRWLVHDKQVTLAENMQQRLGQQIIVLVQSSNFHSGPGDKYHVFTFAGVQQDYRDSIAEGEYLVMSFTPARKISTVGGEVTAAEIVIGLRGPGGRNSVFTIDEAGTVTSHAKYSGGAFMELKRALSQTNP